jgi:hypothetical protein
MMMAEAYIVQALRTAGGRRGGKLFGWHPADLAGQVLNALVDRSGIDPEAIEDVIMGCVSQVGEQSFHIGRNAVLASKLPQSVPAVSIDRQCGSSQQAIQFAAQAVMSGTQDVVIAAGVESMSRVPMGSNFSLHAKAGIGVGPFTKSIQARYGVESFSQFTGAQMMADKYGFSRAELDAFALQSHRRAAAATQAAPHRRGHTLRRHSGIDRRGEAAAAGRQNHRRQRQPDLRWCVRRPGCQRTCVARAQSCAARPHRQSHRHRRRPGDHAGGTDRGDTPRAGPRRPLD